MRKQTNKHVRKRETNKPAGEKQQVRDKQASMEKITAGAESSASKFSPGSIIYLRTDLLQGYPIAVLINKTKTKTVEKTNL